MRHQAVALNLVLMLSSLRGWPQESGGAGPTVTLKVRSQHARWGRFLYPPGGSTLIAVPILFVWLYGTLVLGERRSGYIIMLIGSLIGLAVPLIHVMAAGGIFRGQIAKSCGDFLFVWTLHALALTGIFSLVLAAWELWRLRRGQLPVCPLLVSREV